MSRNGTGSYSLPAGVAFVNGQTADGGMVQSAFNDVAQALTASLSADGQTAWQGNQNGAGYKLTNITVNGVDVTATNSMTVTGAGSLTVPALTFGNSAMGLYRPSDQSLAFVVAGAAKWTADGTKFSLDCGQLKFPGTQVPSTDANTLDDYEEGTWTPTGNSVSLTVANAKYVKIGLRVTAFFDVTWPTTADSTNRARISGLPFACDSVMHGHCGVAYQNTGFALYGLVQPGTQYFDFTDASANIYYNNNFSTKRLIGCATYLASA